MPPRWPWAQTVVTVGLLRRIHGRRNCLASAFAFYLCRKSLRSACIRVRGRAVVFRSKLARAVELIGCPGRVFADAPILVVADSWFGNNGLLKPLRDRFGERAQLLSRLRVNAVLYAFPELIAACLERSRKYGERLGNAARPAAAMRARANLYTLHVYGALRGSRLPIGW